MGNGQSFGPWHVPGQYFSVPAYWEREIQESITAASRDVQIIDCTLSEGEDMVGCHLSWNSWLRLTSMLDELGVGEITVPIGLSVDELRSYMRAVRRLGVQTPICDKLVGIKAPLDSDAWKKHYDAHLSIGADTTVIYLAYPDHSVWSDFTEGPFTREQIVDYIHEVVSYGADKDANIIYSFPDSFRHTLESIKVFCGAAAEAGAYGIYMYDSRGNSNPPASRLISREIKAVIGDKLLYVQHHNDLGMATANALAAAEGGADFLDAAMCGVGDRAGTAALEETACALFAYGWRTGVRLDKLNDVARAVEAAFGFESQATKPIIGWQANMEEGWGHSEPGEDVPEGPMAIAGEVLGRPFESVIGMNVFRKGRHTQVPGMNKNKGFIEDYLDLEGLEYTDSHLEEIERRTIDALIAQPTGYVGIEDFLSIVRGVMEDGEQQDTTVGEASRRGV